MFYQFNARLSGRARGRPRLLTDKEEDGLIAYIVWYEKSGLPLEKWQIQEAIMTIRARRGSGDLPSARSVSCDFIPRFLKRHPELTKSYINALDRSRLTFESTNTTHIAEWFEAFQQLKAAHRISPSDIWNEDECGMQISCLQEKVQVIVTATTRATRPQVLDVANRETVTLLGCCNAIGETIPPFLVLRQTPTTDWAEVPYEREMMFARSDTGFSNKEIMMD